ncbi:hypothetical protein GKQ77_16785 [Streptomyces sp. BG9H]|uniref:Uncharacterized protein n=1 Tax=Streptomyces anatolicus TaxID=2675858 RepID=A0ABS6YP39_9ACTN|nr:hypothetical protein [Streptomyces anatolicus]MBW5423199.1 hypothetical protein [Streptomyces anatolicus]
MQRNRRVVSATLLGLLALTLAVGAAPASAAERKPPSPIPVPAIDTLISEGITVEGPLINGVVLPHLL